MQALLKSDLFRKQKCLENIRRKTKENAVFTDTPLKVALEAKVVPRAKLDKCNRLFSDSQQRLRKPKQLKTNI
jgi:hypothetical protein